jgi:adenosine deaminase
MIELHRHLLGSIRLNTLRDLAIKYNLQEAKYSIEDFYKLFQLTNKVFGLEVYIKPWELIRKLIRTPEDIYRISYESAIDAHLDGVKYIEFRNTPTNLYDIYTIGPQFKIPTFSYLDSIQEGFKKASLETGIIVKLIISIQRQLTYSLSQNSKMSLAKKYLKIFEKYHSDLIVGVDLTGLEAGYHTKEFYQMFNLFSKEKIPLTIHTGETENAYEVWDSINFLNPNRIGHGLAIATDIELLNEIKSRNIAIEICPTSNWILSNHSTIAEHPLVTYLMSNDVDVIICTDNTTVCKTVLSNEIKLCSQALSIPFELLKEQQIKKAKKHVFYSNF